MQSFHTCIMVKVVSLFQKMEQILNHNLVMLLFKQAFTLNEP